MSQVEDSVRQIIAIQLDYDARDLDRETSLYDGEFPLFGDELAIAEVCMALEEQFEINLSDEVVRLWLTVGDIADTVEAACAGAETPFKAQPGAFDLSGPGPKEVHAMRETETGLLHPSGLVFPRALISTRSNRLLEYRFLGDGQRPQLQLHYERSDYHLYRHGAAAAPPGWSREAQIELREWINSFRNRQASELGEEVMPGLFKLQGTFWEKENYANELRHEGFVMGLRGFAMPRKGQPERQVFVGATGVRGLFLVVSVDCLLADHIQTRKALETEILVLFETWAGLSC
ncbi:MAG TPA: acyl carrier protein [Polyangiaceae bacterium]|nr:acyl carrier protein [Polyangiaceae bacterium]